MPAAIRSSGQMWGPDGKLHDMKAMIPTAATRASTRSHRRLPQERAFDADDVSWRTSAHGPGRRGARFTTRCPRFRQRHGPRLDADARRSEHRVEQGDIWRCAGRFADPRLAKLP
jgi:isocitrate dehydrogenase